MDAADRVRSDRQDPIHNLNMAFLPSTVGYRYAAVSMRMTRSAMLEVMQEDYIRTARAKGLIQKLIVNRHALKNALLPVVTLIGIEFAFLIGAGRLIGFRPHASVAVVQARRAEPGLHAVTSPGDVDRYGVRHLQPDRGSALWVARSAHSLQLKARASSW